MSVSVRYFNNISSMQNFISKLIQIARISSNPSSSQKGIIEWKKHMKLGPVESRLALRPELFDNSPQRTPISPKTFVHITDSWVFFRQRHITGFQLDSYTFMPVIRFCSAFSNHICGIQVHCLIIKTGSESETVIRTALIDMYSKCDCLPDAIRIFEGTKLKDVVTWNAMLMGFVRHGLGREAIKIFREMLKNRVEYSVFTLCSLLKLCGSMNALRQGKQIHGLTAVTGCDSLILGTALVDLYSNCTSMDDAIEVFCKLNCRKDDAIYNAVISGCVQNRKYKEAFTLLGSIQPNGIALTSVLDACSELCDLSNGKQIHCVIVRRGFDIDTLLCNAVMDMYAKCGKINVAWSVFDQISEKNVVSWTGIINAYGSHGFGKEALDLFNKMEQSGVSPNSVTFLAVLSACGHSGLVEEARDCYILMREKQGIDPGPDHYACLISLLGRAGRIEEVWDLFDEMCKCDLKPSAAVWAAFLNACRVNLDVERGEFAAKHLLKLEPDKPEYYILLSNFYATLGKWEGVEKLRRMMREKGLRKEAANSWLAVDCPKNRDITSAFRKNLEGMIC